MTTPSPRFAELLRSRVLFVSGKGGTGKSVGALALARLAAAQGRRVLLVEMDAQRPALTTLVGRAPTYAPMPIGAGVHVANLTWDEALDDWLKHVVSVPRLVRTILKNRVVTLFLEATPGARDLVVMTRVLQLAREFDTVVVDMPASGNAVAMISVAHTAQRLFVTGPVRRCADELLALYGRPDVCAVLVALPEEMVVNETLETAAKIARECAPLRLGAVLLNRAAPWRFSEDERAVLSGLAARPGLTAEAQGIVDAGGWALDRAAATQDAATRLSEGLGGVPVLALPALPNATRGGAVAEQLGAALRSAVVLGGAT